MTSGLRALNVVVSVLVVSLMATAAAGQVQTGEIFGRVSDGSSAVLPGVTVTLQGRRSAPEIAVTTETGAYRFPRVPVGIYRVRYELPGFKQLIQEGDRRSAPALPPRSTSGSSCQPCRKPSP